jgi:hypothetical protein
MCGRRESPCSVFCSRTCIIVVGERGEHGILQLNVEETNVSQSAGPKASLALMGRMVPSQERGFQKSTHVVVAPPTPADGLGSCRISFSPKNKFFTFLQRQKFVATATLVIIGGAEHLHIVRRLCSLPSRPGVYVIQRVPIQPWGSWEPCLCVTRAIGVGTAG